MQVLISALELLGGGAVFEFFFFFFFLSFEVGEKLLVLFEGFWKVFFVFFVFSMVFKHVFLFLDQVFVCWFCFELLLDGFSYRFCWLVFVRMKKREGCSFRSCFCWRWVWVA